MCMAFDSNPQIDFLVVRSFFELKTFRYRVVGLKAFRYWVSCERNSSYSFKLNKRKLN